MRLGKFARKTLETSVEAVINLDGTGKGEVESGVAFLDHMLVSLARHGLLDVSVKASGDIGVDSHHVIEDIGITLGVCLRRAVGGGEGIERFGEARIPMDEALASVALDIGGRGYLVFEGFFQSERVGGFPTQMTRHFFASFTENAGVTAHISVVGENDHHKIEAVFKAFGVALKRAVRVTGGGVPSTKGVI